MFEKHFCLDSASIATVLAREALRDGMSHPYQVLDHIESTIVSALDQSAHGYDHWNIYSTHKENVYCQTVIFFWAVSRQYYSAAVKRTT